MRGVSLSSHARFLCRCGSANLEPDGQAVPPLFGGAYTAQVVSLSLRNCRSLRQPSAVRAEALRVTYRFTLTYDDHVKIHV